MGDFGANVAPTTNFLFEPADIQQDLAPPPFWHTNEDIILQLIALAAQSLIHLHPFQDHPAHRNTKGNAMYRQPLLTKGGYEAEDLTSQIFRLIRRNHEPGRRAAQPASSQRKPSKKA